ncbi:EAL and HDOD domain-containing protein [Crenobacter caeni]|uniref:HDOD domain-containing protein n=1 Tax=Crenobacter caeni TaxID=2705474 RepID=A0A6B2KNF0_9NEIS|nr:HDOD domain-containing protein [Crenobacter caeni]NDV11756.1 HDOD domain-containing protein [Crenobacter caeni]
MLKTLFGARDSTRHAQADDKPLPSAIGFARQQALFDARLRLCGNDFSLSRALGETGAHGAHFDRQLLQVLANLGAVRENSPRFALVRLQTAASVDAPELLALPASRLILYPALDSTDFTALEATSARLSAFKSRGGRLALPATDHGQPLPASLLALADLVVLDLAGDSRSVLGALAGRGLPAAPTLLADRIGSEEALAACLKLAGHRRLLLSGSVFAQQRPRVDARAQASRLRVLEILRLLRSGAPVAQIEAQFKLDSTLLFKLLRYINSPAMGFSRRIQTLEETLMLMGRDALLRWLSLLLFTAGDEDPAAGALMERALRRGRFMETLGGELGAKRIECEHLFLAGMFSELDKLLGMPMAEAVAPLELPVPVRQTLVDGRGLFAPHLNLAVALETGDDAQAGTLARMLGVGFARAGMLDVEAAQWAESVSCAPATAPD